MRIKWSLTPHPAPPHEPPFQLDAVGSSVKPCFLVCFNDPPHPNPLPQGEGTAIACASLFGCVSCESCRRYFQVQGFNARTCWGKSLPVGRGEGEFHFRLQTKSCVGKRWPQPKLQH